MDELSPRLQELFDQIRAGTARRLVKPGQHFSRIHVDDIVAVLRLGLVDLLAKLLDRFPARLARLVEIVRMQRTTEVVAEDLAQITRHGEFYPPCLVALKQILGITLGVCA